MSREDRQQPEFSIVTICRNDLRGLQRTIASVQRQRCPSWEHIVVDGGSSDGTREFLEGLHDSRLSWTSAPDNGIYDAMNKGVARALGKLVLIVNSSDALVGEEALDTYHEDQIRHEWLWSYAAIRLTDEHGEVLGAYTFDPFKRWRFMMGLDWIPFASVCFTREFLDRVGPFRTDLGSSADQELLMRAVVAAPPHVITYFAADYALGGTSQTVAPRQREMAWHRMRRLNGTPLRGSVVADRIASEALALRKPLRILARRLGASQ